jgi:hypothetical protein
MVKLVAQFRRPKDPEQLLADVVGLVLPRCRTIPGVERVDLAFADEDDLAGVGVLQPQRGDRRGPPYLIAEMYFADRTVFDDALATPEAEGALGELLDVCDREVHVFLADASSQD